MRLFVTVLLLVTLQACAHRAERPDEYYLYESFMDSIEPMTVIVDYGSIKKQISFSDVIYDSIVEAGGDAKEPTILWSEFGKLRFYLPPGLDLETERWRYNGCDFEVVGRSEIISWSDNRYRIFSVCDDGVVSQYHYSERNGLLAFGYGEACSNRIENCIFKLRDVYYLHGSIDGFGRKKNDNER